MNFFPQIIVDRMIGHKPNHAGHDYGGIHRAIIDRRDCLGNNYIIIFATRYWTGPKSIRGLLCFGPLVWR